METRTANLIIGTSGGTAGGNATNYKLALPSTWIKEMGLTPEQRQVEQLSALSLRVQPRPADYQTL